MLLLLLVRGWPCRCFLYLSCYTAEKDYSGGTMVINVPIKVSTKSFEITIMNTGIVDCNKTFNVTIKSVSNCGATIGNVNNSEVVIRDNNSE